MNFKLIYLTHPFEAWDDARENDDGGVIDGLLVRDTQEAFANACLKWVPGLITDLTAAASDLNHDDEGKRTIIETVRGELEQLRRFKEFKTKGAGRCDGYGVLRPGLEGVTFCRKAGARIAEDILKRATEAQAEIERLTEQVAHHKRNQDTLRNHAAGSFERISEAEADLAKERQAHVEAVLTIKSQLEYSQQTHQEDREYIVELEANSGRIGQAMDQLNTILHEPEHELARQLVEEKKARAELLGVFKSLAALTPKEMVAAARKRLEGEG